MYICLDHIEYVEYCVVNLYKCVSKVHKYNTLKGCEQLQLLQSCHPLN